MNKQLKLVLIIGTIALLLISGCKKWFKDEELTLVKQSYSGNDLRLDGYYYYEDNGKIWRTYFFYRDGVMLYGAGTDTLDNNLEKYDTWFASDFFLEYIKTNKRRWGLFEIHNDSILFERWVFDEMGLPVLRFSGNIINDTTFVITRRESPYTGKEFEENELYHFRQFSPKPDSTNTFIP